MSRITTDEMKRLLAGEKKYLFVWTHVQTEGTWEFYEKLVLLALKHIRQHSFNIHNEDTVRYFDDRGVGGNDSEGEDSDIFEFRKPGSNALALRLVRSQAPPPNQLTGSPPPTFEIALHDQALIPLFEDIMNAASSVGWYVWDRVEVLSNSETGSA
jgi:hypothetical protein